MSMSTRAIIHVGTQVHVACDAAHHRRDYVSTDVIRAAPVTRLQETCAVEERVYHVWSRTVRERGRVQGDTVASQL
jgi:hypothetical protein